MANQRLTDKTSLAENLASDDVLMVVDKSDSTGSTAGTSKQVESKYIIQTTKVAISNAEFLLLATTGKTIVSAPGSGYSIIPISVYCEYTEGATPNTATVSSTIGFTDGDIAYYWDQTRFWMDSPTYTSGSFCFTGGSPSSKGMSPAGQTTDDRALIFYFQSAPSIGSTGSLVLYVTYQIIKR